MQLLRAFGFALAASTAALAQCDLQPTATGRGVPSVDAYAGRIVEWDPDGAGPLGPKLVVSGFFRLAGNLPAEGIAMFDPASDQWSPLGQIDGLVQSFVVLPNGLLLAGGRFASPAPSGSLLKVWTGSAWSAAIPQPQGEGVSAMAVGPNGELFVSCWVGSSATVQRLHASGWQTLGTATSLVPTNFYSVQDLAFDSSGNLLIAGAFDAVDGVAAAAIARWNGSSWSPLGSGVVGVVHDLLVTSSGEICAGGSFALGSPAQDANVARWSGSSWQALGTGTQGWSPVYAGVRALVEVPGGIVAGGQFQAAGGVAAYRVAQWNGSAWSAMGGGIELYGPLGEPSTVYSLQRTANGEIFATGDFGTISGRDGKGLARWNGTSWRPLQPVGIGAPTTSVHCTSSGDVYLGGAFRDIDGVACNGIARRVGNGWQPLGGGIGIYPGFGFDPIVNAITSLPTGEIVVGGQFPSAGGVAAASLAAWNGTAWAPLGGGLTHSPGPPWVASLHVAGNGDLYAAGTFGAAGGVAVECLARWNGSQWSSPSPGLAALAGQPIVVQDVTTSPSGDLYLIGEFVGAGPGLSARVAALVGGQWQLLGTLDSVAHCLLALPNGDLLVAGTLQSVDGIPVGNVARWSNGSWSPLGGLGLGSFASAVRRLRVVPGGDLLAAGHIEQNGVAHRFARWHSGAWTVFDPSASEVADFAFDQRGEVLAAGNFLQVGGVASAHLLRLVLPCPAQLAAAGSGCVGSGGQNQLAASDLPWLGEILVANASGMPNNSVAMTVLGLGTLSLPLPSLLPQGGAGCELLVTPDALGLVVPSGGQTLVPLALPLLPALVGGVLHLQVVPIEFGVGGAITSVTSTNRLSLTLGIF